MNTLINPDLIKLEILASVAAQLLVGDNYDEAATRAMNLLASCQRKLTENGRRFEEHAEQQRNRQQEQLNHEQRTVPFDEAVKTITGQEKRSDAYRCIREYFKKEGQSNPENHFNWKKSEGIEASDITPMRERYLRFFPQRRPKKSLVSPSSSRKRGTKRA